MMDYDNLVKATILPVIACAIGLIIDSEALFVISLCTALVFSVAAIAVMAAKMRAERLLVHIGAETDLRKRRFRT